MIKRTLALVSIAMLPFTAHAEVEIGKLAPAFTGTDMYGKEVTLDQYRGKTVVLEWNNPGCPFVVKHYSGGNMQALQKEATADGVVWLTINSGGEGKQGSMSNEQAQASFKEKDLASTAYLLDPSGKIGKAYDAKTTPHMFVIDAEGLLVYAGAIDSNASFDSDDIAGAENYVKTALASIKAGTPIKTASTKPYGCSVKYSD